MNFRDPVRVQARALIMTSDRDLHVIVPDAESRKHETKRQKKGLNSQMMSDF